MSALTFRNSHGELVDVATVAASKLKNSFGAIFEKATLGQPVAITKHDTPKAVLISYEEFAALVQARGAELNRLSAEFETMLQGMQSSKARKAMTAAFNAAPAELGRAAVKAARKKR
jgi:prevent-host-death family protein